MIALLLFTFTFFGSFLVVPIAASLLAVRCLPWMRGMMTLPFVPALAAVHPMLLIWMGSGLNAINSAGMYMFAGGSFILGLMIVPITLFASGR